MRLESTTSDLALWSRIQQGEERAFKLLFDNYYPGLCDFSNLYSKNIAAAKEIVADVFFKLWQQRKTITVNTSLKAYLYTSVRNHAINYLKAQKLKIVSLDHYVENGNDSPQNGEHKLLFDELETMVTNEINRLPQRQKEVFKMSRLYGMSYKEISETLSISVYTVQEHMVDALKSMSKGLKRYVSF